MNISHRLSYIYTILFKRPGRIRLLVGSCIFSIILLSVRIGVTGSWFYLFLCWNLFLAAIPFAITHFAMGGVVIDVKKIIHWIGFLTWLLFIPNSFYIITDLFHLDEGSAAPQWFDLILIFSFAWNGLMLGVISLQRMETQLGGIFNKVQQKLFLYSILFLNGLGVYVGRYLRYNSWDVLSNPFRLFKDILFLCIHPFSNIHDWGMITCFTLLMYFIYHSITGTSHEQQKR